MPEEIMSLRTQLKRVLEAHYSTFSSVATLPPEITAGVREDALANLKICVTRYSTNYEVGPHATLTFELCAMSERRSRVPCILIYRYADGEYMVALESNRHAIVINTQTDRIWMDGNPVDSLNFNNPDKIAYTGIDAITQAINWLIPAVEQKNVTG